MSDAAFDGVKKMVEETIQKAGFDVVEIQFPRYKSRQLVRVFIDKAGGITLDECKRVSIAIGEKLEIEDPFQMRYTLEVSSPGVDRLLKTGNDFRRNIGRTLELRVSGGPDETITYTGTLKEITGERLVLETADGPVDIDISAIQEGKVRALL